LRLVGGLEGGGGAWEVAQGGGAHLAALITYYGFLSLFPLLLLASTVVSVVLRGDPHAQQAVLHSELRQFPVVGNQLAKPEHLSGGLLGTVIGLLGALYGGVGVALAGQSAMNTIWAVPRNHRPNPIKARGRAVALLASVGVAVLLTTGLSAVGGGAGPFGTGLRIVTLIAAFAVNLAAFVVGFRLAPAGPCRSVKCCPEPSPQPWPGSCCNWAASPLSPTPSGTPAPRTVCSPWCWG